MIQRLLKFVAAPLALSLMLLVAKAVGLPPALEWVLLVVTMAAWLGSVVWIGATGGRSADASRMIAEERALLAELRSFVSNEIEGTRSEVNRTRELIREAVAKLGVSFDSMMRRSKDQAGAVSRIVDRSDGGGVDGFSQQQAPGFLQADVLLVLQGAHGRHGLEVVVQRRGAHVHPVGQGVDGQGLVEVVLEPADGPGHPVAVAVGQ